MYAIIPGMKHINWNPHKNQQLIKDSDLSFEDVVYYLREDRVIDDIKHPNSEKYPNQRIFVLDIDGYIHLVPYVEDRNKIFLKTVIPSRKATKKYLGEIK